MKIYFKKVGVGADVTGAVNDAAARALEGAGHDQLVCSVRCFYDAVAACRQQVMSATVYCPSPHKVDVCALRERLGWGAVP